MTSWMLNFSFHNFFKNQFFKINKLLFLEWEVEAVPDHVIGGDREMIDVGVDHNLDHREDLDLEAAVGHLLDEDEIQEILEIQGQDIKMIDVGVIIIEGLDEDGDNLKRNNHHDHQIDHFLLDQ